jgi:hypothetical protein
MKKLPLLLTLMIMPIARAQLVQKIVYVDEQPEYVRLGPHPIMSMSLMNGKKELYVF